MLISIILPYYGRWDLTHARLSELYRFALENVEIILVNDASPEEDCRSGAGFWQSQSKHKIKYIQNKENLGFGGSHNRGQKGHGIQLVALIHFMAKWIMKIWTCLCLLSIWDIILSH